MTLNKYLYFIFLLLSVSAVHSQSADSIITRVFSPEDSSRVKVRRLDINSVNSDFSPVLHKSSLLFVSGRPGVLVVSYANENKTEITDLYVSAKKDSVNFLKPKSVSKIINTRFNESSFTLTHTGDTIYFTGNSKQTADKAVTGRLQVYQSNKNGEEWTVPVEAPFCDHSSSNLHPALSGDNRLLVFCSDMPGGYGGTDLYYSKFENNNWTKPVNFGPRVNGPSNELFPYVFKNSELYFSSNRGGGNGGLDIYMFDLHDTLQSPLLMKPPVNSAFDDFGICLDSTGKAGYFSSNRKVSTGDDIYYFSIGYPDFSRAITPAVKKKFCYSFFEENGYQSNDSVTMAYEWDFGDGEKSRDDRCKHCFSKPGSYFIQLNVVEKSSGEVFFNRVSYTLTVEEPPKLTINSPDTTIAGKEMILSAEKSAIKGFTITAFYWSFGDGRYNSGTFVKHKFRKPGTYTIELGVIAKNEQTQRIEKFKLEKNIVVKDNL